ncbi:YnbE family lipoprotein [Candidatus Sodalis endolongispinus]|uniref:YnbE family lipoprotein n=1 Tax=Candidatus Sodalis endolongispinus TaxID=2812662 RepID=A0ABS5YEQ2_9GAMM|nr:YnbE family lipoprotein [Candidatus Sodalis endolongispinus]MBT9433202.1 YnbE family lipoprotein [Candidatus Sodalis endolongispinus]
MHWNKSLMALLSPLLLTQCVPRIEIATPTTPITINMNVKIDHDIHIKADPQSEALLNRERASQAPSTGQ